MPLSRVSGGISGEWFQRRSRTFTHLLGTIGLKTNRIRRHLLLPVSCKMQLNTAQKFLKMAFVEVRKNGSKCHIRRLWVEFFQNDLSEDCEIFTQFSGIMSLTNMPYMTSLAAFGHLQDAIKYCTKVCKKAPGQQRVE